MVQSVVGSILHGVDPLSYFLFQPVLHDWCNKGRGMYYPVCGMMHIKEPLLLIGKSSSRGCSRFLLLLSEWSFSICHITVNKNVLSALLNKIFACRLWDLDLDDNYVLSLDGHSSYDQNETIICLGFNAEKGRLFHLCLCTWGFLCLVQIFPNDTCILD